MRLASLLRPSVLTLVTLVLMAGLVAVAPAPSATARAGSAPPGCGTWVLQEVADKASLERKARQIKAVLGKKGVSGLSLRVPWSTIDRNFRVLNKAAKLAKARHKKLSVRFMAGRSTPARVFNEGAYYYTSGGEKIPKPFSNSGRPGNPVFERNYKAVVKKLKVWSHGKRVKLLHLPWYGYQWAEIYNGSAVQSARGYSYHAWLKGHLKLLRIGMKFGTRKRPVEFALSGDWGGQGAAAGTIADKIVDIAGAWSRRVLVQGNGLGRWNAPATNRRVFHAKQMVDGGSYDWADIYRTLRANDEAYVEVYLDSFTGGGRRELLSEARKFKSQRC
jgi:hypothetical protein